MGTVIVVEFVTADGVIEDPDGSAGSPIGGWAFHAGPEVFAGDKFDVAPHMASGALLLGRRTWEMFASRWPARTGGFADVMNGSRKVVVSTTTDDVSAWDNSSPLTGDLVSGVAELREGGDLIVAGSIRLVHALDAAGLVDQYRLIVIPAVVGGGAPLFLPGTTRKLRLASAEQRGATVLVTYDVER